MLMCCRVPPRKPFRWIKHFYRSFHITPRIFSISVTDKGHPYSPLGEVVKCRRSEARRSLLVEVAGLGSAGDLHHVCSQFGCVEHMFHYTTRRRNDCKEMILVEFQDEESLSIALANASSLSSSRTIPACTPYVWLAAERPSSRGKESASRIKEHSKSSKSETKDSSGIGKDSASKIKGYDKSSKSNSEDSVGNGGSGENVTDRTRDGGVSAGNPTNFTVQVTLQDSEDLLTRMLKCKDMSEQIQILYDTQKMTEIGWRLRFFSCWQVELALNGLFPRATVLPFGSSINSFGKSTCDLDMNLELEGQESQNQSSRLIFQSKKCPSESYSRLVHQRNLEVVADLLHCFMPGCSEVMKILNAKVPIVKYRQDLTGLECDLTLANSSGYHMSQMLYLYGECDPRVRPLVFAVKQWARDHQLTSSVKPGRWVTNFPLTVMVLFYLMNVTPKVIHPLNDLGITTLNPNSEVEVARFIFPSNLHLQPSKNKDSLETLLRGFFEFYDKFNFKNHAISLVHGTSFIKPDHGALYVQNPLSVHLNVSQNVTLEEMERIRRELTNARYLLEGCEDVSSTTEAWGALNLWSSLQKSHPIDTSFSHSVDWADIFLSDKQNEKTATRSKKPQKQEVRKEVQKTVSGANTVRPETEKLRQWENRKRNTEAMELNDLVSNLKQRALTRRLWKKNRTTQSSKR